MQTLCSIRPIFAARFYRALAITCAKRLRHFRRVEQQWSLMERPENVMSKTAFNERRQSQIRRRMPSAREEDKGSDTSSTSKPSKQKSS